MPEMRPADFLKNQIRREFVSNERGVTLIEMLVYLALSSMLLGAAVMAFQVQNRTYNAQDLVAETQQNVRGALAMMAAEIRMAGFDPVQKGANFLTANQNVISFEYWEDTDDDGDYDDETIRIITYDLYDAYGDGDMDIGRLVGTSATAKKAIAENIEQLRFEYMFWNNKVDRWEWANDSAAIQAELGITSGKALEAIRAVKVIILGGSRGSAYSGSDPTTYKPPLEGSGVGTTWTAAAGSGYKRLVSVVIQCRNNRG